MNITKCKKCNSPSLKKIEKFECEDTMTNEIVFRDVLFCNSCECIHYYKDDIFCYEFYVRPTIERVLNYVSDQDLAKMKINDPATN